MVDDLRKATFIKIAESYAVEPSVAAEIFEAWQAEDQKTYSGSSFSFINVLYYFGGLLIILAMTWFVAANWEELGGRGIAAVAGIYMVILFSLGRYLWQKDDFKVPGGLFVTAAVSITPLAVYGIEKALDLWLDGRPPDTFHDYHVWVKGNWFFMEVATLITGLIALFFVRFPFITAPIAVTL